MSEHLDRHATRLDSAERRMSEAEDGIADMLKLLECVECILKTIRQEQRPRSVIPPQQYLHCQDSGDHQHRMQGYLLAELLGRTSFTDTSPVERVHISLCPRPIPGASPRPFFPDFTPLVPEALRKFADVKSTLPNRGLKYGKLYPESLRIEMAGQHYVFNTSAESVKFCKHPWNPAR
ncbi:hypothetical protein NDU88_004477 [Pleurodeles waltl]|uniref:Uncharacterized protein n=1 Tax=Pleurodeles waltl TaxID=8319 RepID=A0AAV7SJ11_PLEWA|nr:hypothetical protein NDU88_004477 [Pleurodeles waltl]